MNGCVRISCQNIHSDSISRLYTYMYHANAMHMHVPPTLASPTSYESTQARVKKRGRSRACIEYSRAIAKHTYVHATGYFLYLTQIQNFASAVST